MRMSLFFLTLVVAMTPSIVHGSFWSYLKGGDEETTTTNSTMPEETSSAEIQMKIITTTKKPKRQLTTTVKTTSTVTPKTISTTLYPKFIEIENSLTTGPLSTSSSPPSMLLKFPTSQNPFPSIEQSIQESSERFKKFQLELQRSELEVGYLVMLNLQEKLSKVHGNLSTLYGRECSTTLNDNSLSSPHKNDLCPTSPKIVEAQIVEFEQMVNVNLKFRQELDSFKNKYSNAFYEMHESFENSLRLCGENAENEMEPELKIQLKESQPIPKSIKNDIPVISERQEIPKSDNFKENQDVSSTLQDLLSQKLKKIEALTSSSQKISQFKALIKEVTAKGIQKNPDIFRLASFIKNTKCRADSATLKAELPLIVQQLIWSERLFLKTKKNDKTFKLVINFKHELIGVEIKSDEKEEYGQFWKLSPVLEATNFILYNDHRKSVVGAGLMANDSSPSLVSADPEKVNILVDSAVGRDLVLSPKEFMWQVQLSCVQTCKDDDFTISFINHAYPGVGLNLDSSGKVIPAPAKEAGQFFIGLPNKMSMKEKTHK